MICNKTIDCTSYTILIASIGLHNIALVLLFIFFIVGNHVHLLYHIAAEHCFWNLFYYFYAFGVLVCASYLCVVGADRAGASVGVGEGILLIMPWFHQLSDWSISTGKWKKNDQIIIFFSMYTIGEIVIWLVSLGNPQRVFVEPYEIGIPYQRRFSGKSRTIQRALRNQP